MNLFGSAEKLISKVNEIHEKFVEAQTEFRLLREQTESTLTEFRGALERVVVRVEAMQMEDVRAHAELKADIKGLVLRLDALSERALHAVAEKVARDGFRVMSGEPALSPHSSPGVDDE